MGRPTNPYRKPDRFTQRAKDEGYAARSIYKLEEIQKRFHLLRPGQRVVDLGNYPGSWSRYLLQQVGRNGRVVGVDLQAPDLPGGHWIAASVFDVSADTLREALGGPADAVFSDMAPNTTGERLHDHVLQIELARRALELARALLVPGGSFVVKVFDGEDAVPFVNDARALFDAHKRVRPEAVRQNSREFFLVCTGFRAATSGVRSPA